MHRGVLLVMVFMFMRSRYRFGGNAWKGMENRKPYLLQSTNSRLLSPFPSARDVYEGQEPKPSA